MVVEGRRRRIMYHRPEVAGSVAGCECQACEDDSSQRAALAAAEGKEAAQEARRKADSARTEASARRAQKAKENMTKAKAPAKVAQETPRVYLVNGVNYALIGDKLVPVGDKTVVLPPTTATYDIRGLGVSDAKLVVKVAKLLGAKVSGEPASWPEYDAEKAAHWRGAQFAANVKAAGKDYRNGAVELVQTRAQYAEPRKG